jgi:hypothetical protein
MTDGVMVAYNDVVMLMNGVNDGAIVVSAS